MSDYTPVTEEIRQLCAHGDTEPPADNVWVNPEKYARFDRWLAQERAQAKAEALREIAGELETAYKDDVLEARPEYVQWLRDCANELEVKP